MITRKKEIYKGKTNVKDILIHEETYTPRKTRKRITHGMDIHTEGTYTRRGHIHGGDIHTEGTRRGHTHGEDIHTEKTDTWRGHTH